MSKRVTKDELARNLARCRLIVEILKGQVSFSSLYLPFIDSTLHRYYGKEAFENMLKQELEKFPEPKIDPDDIPQSIIDKQPTAGL